MTQMGDKMKNKITLIMFLTMTSALAYTEIKPSVVDSYREEIREILIQNHRGPKKWRHAKEFMFNKLFLEKDEKGYFLKDLYCNKIIRKSVGPTDMPDNLQINAEHTWPQSKFPNRNSTTQKSDLHHLFPTDSKTNSRRGNYPFTEVAENNLGLTACASSKMNYISEARVRGFEPPESHKGNVARALFYFAIRYNAKIPDYEELVLRLWHLTDPVDSEEQRRNDVIETFQGNRNIFVDNPNFSDLIEDF